MLLCTLAGRRVVSLDSYRLGISSDGLYMCVCVCIYVYVCMFIFVYVCMYACVAFCVCVCMYICIYVCMCVLCVFRSVHCRRTVAHALEHVGGSAHWPECGAAVSRPGLHRGRPRLFRHVYAQNTTERNWRFHDACTSIAPSGYGIEHESVQLKTCIYY